MEQDRCDNVEPDQAHSWKDLELARIGVGLAVVFDAPCGIESGLVYGPLWNGSVCLVLAVMLTCVLLIYSPIMVLAARHRVAALRQWRWHIAAMIVITSLFHVPGLVMLWMRFRHT